MKNAAKHDHKAQATKTVETLVQMYGECGYCGLPLTPDHKDEGWDWAVIAPEAK